MYSLFLFFFFWFYVFLFLSTLLLFWFLLCGLVGFIFNWLISFLVCFVHWVTPLYFAFFGMFWLHSSLCVCMTLCFVFACLLLLFSFVWVSFWAFCFFKSPSNPWQMAWGFLVSPIRSPSWASGAGTQSPGERLRVLAWSLGAKRETAKPRHCHCLRRTVLKTGGTAWKLETA